MEQISRTEQQGPWLLHLLKNVPFSFHGKINVQAINLPQFTNDAICMN